MLREAIADQLVSELAIQLGASFASPLIDPPSLKGFVLPQKFSLPVRCFRQNGRYVLVHTLASAEISPWVQKARLQIGQRQNVSIILIAPITESSSGTRIASVVAEKARSLGFGLAAQTTDGVFLIFPPKFTKPKETQTPLENGHIPSWLYTRASSASGLSRYMLQRLHHFRTKYENASGKSEINYSKECRLLTDLAEEIAEGDPRLFFPLERLQTLKAYERAGSNTLARDHFFHTFNNFFLGLVVLEESLRDRDPDSLPDASISRGRQHSRLHSWEALWFLTCLFHDPGYLPENFWSLLSFGYGLENDPRQSAPVPVEVRQRIENAWHTELLKARNHLGAAYVAVRQSAGHSKKELRGAEDQFNSAIRRAYYDGTTTGHSLISGLTLIQLSLADVTVPHEHFDRKTAIEASKLAALGMLFHDQKCRNTLLSCKIPSLQFQYLPYASVLMFVDALQDDRRDVTKSRFPKSGILNAIHTDGRNGIITAEVRLRNLPLHLWPSRIAEYQSVMRWINPNSTLKFIISYQKDQQLPQ